MSELTKKAFLASYQEAGGSFKRYKNTVAYKEFPISDRSFRRRVTKWNARDLLKQPPEAAQMVPTLPVAQGTLESPDKRRRKLEGKRYVFTAAQNNTHVHEGFLRNLQAYCVAIQAELVVSRFRYNKNGFQNLTEDSDDLWYDPGLSNFFVDESCDITQDKDGLVFCGELDILPTAANPLASLDSYTRAASCIIPHTKVALKSVPRMPGRPPKLLYSTGACTLRNYIQRKAGQKAEFHHTYGALLVEIDDIGNSFCRQLIADDNGDFIDLDVQVSNGFVDTSGGTVEALHFGDIHAEKVDREVATASWGFRSGSTLSMLEELKPNYVFLHDLIDFSSRNHHNVKDPLFMQQHRNSTVEDDLWDAKEQLEEVLANAPSTCQVVIVESNHDLAFKKWLCTADIQSDLTNAEFFYFWNYKLHGSARPTEYPVFQEALLAAGGENLEAAVADRRLVFLTEKSSFVICGDNGIECALHGHNGPNGARGNPDGLRKMGRKVNLGHTHSPAIMDGVYVAGTSSKLDMGYNKGPSSWVHSHIVTYTNGKRAILTIKNGKWRA